VKQLPTPYIINLFGAASRRLSSSSLLAMSCVRRSACASCVAAAFALLAAAWIAGPLFSKGRNALQVARRLQGVPEFNRSVDEDAVPFAGQIAEGTNAEESVHGAGFLNQGCAYDWANCAGSGCCHSSYMLCYKKDNSYAQCRPSCIKGVHLWDVVKTPWSCEVLSGGIYNPTNEQLRQSSSGRTYTFYMYRAQNDQNYAPENQNMGNLAGIMWYLHNEIVNNKGTRRFGKTRIQRFKVTMKATQPLVDARMVFGVRLAFDRGLCTGPFNCDLAFQKYGFFVGCNFVREFPTQQWKNKVFYSDAIWYSLPGKCSSKSFDKHSMECELQSPGGSCMYPSGEGNCTYHYEEAGMVTIDELEGISDFKAFAAAGGWEYNNQTDRGVHMTFWDDKYNRQACDDRVRRGLEAFARKYPYAPAYEAPQCDFDAVRFYAR